MFKDRRVKVKVNLTLTSEEAAELLRAVRLTSLLSHYLPSDSVYSSQVVNRWLRDNESKDYSVSLQLQKLNDLLTLEVDEIVIE